MYKRFTLTLAASVALSLPAIAFAHGDVAHTASAKPAAHHHQGGHENGGHAAALGVPATPDAATQKTVGIIMRDTMRFSPANIEIKRGETIRFVVQNEGQVKHEMVLGSMKELKKHAALMRKFPEMEHDDPNAVSVDPGKTGEFAWTFTKVGRFDFACLVPGHFEAGMKGRIIVKK